MGAGLGSQLLPRQDVGMPYRITHSRYGCRVQGPSGRFYSRKAIPCDRAKKQERLLRAIEHGWIPPGRRSRKPQKPRQTQKRRR